MKYFKVLHDFSSTDVVELSVKKGDLVCAQERIEQDGWIKVELASDTRRKGFVPATYVREVSNAGGPSSSFAGTTATPSRNHQYAPQDAHSNTFTNAALSYAEKAMGGAAHPSPLQAAYSSASKSSIGHNQSSTIAVAAPPVEPSGMHPTTNFLANPNAVVEAFMKNEVYFKQLMKQRQESLVKLENGIAEALTDVSACKDKNSILARKLRDLDNTIEKERKKWKERVEEEKSLVHRAANTTSATGLLSHHTTTTSYSATTSQQRSLSHQPMTASARSSAAR